MQLRKEQIPWIMAGGRAALGPLMIAGQACGWNGLTLAAMIVAALLSDIFDGILARHWHCDTSGVRLFDSMADTVFYIGVAIALWIRRPQLLHEHAVLFIAVLSMEAARFAFDFAKFGKPASYHSYLAKTWGLVLATAVVKAFASEYGSAWIMASLLLGIVCNAEGLAMSLALPKWTRDVKTLSAALRMRLMILNVPEAMKREMAALKPARIQKAATT